MMKAPFSEYLNRIAPDLKELVEELKREFDYVSVLSTDSVGFTASVSQHSKSVSGKTMTTERGTVVRVMKDGQYSEYAYDLNEPNAAEKLKTEIKAQLAVMERLKVSPYPTGAISDEPIELFVEKETESLPEKTDMDELIESFTGISDEGMRTIPGALDCFVRASSTHISKLFITPNRFMRQSYVYSEATIAAFSPSEDGETRMIYEGVSGLGGPEIFKGLNEKLKTAGKEMEELLKAEKIVPGEYEIITDPGISGLIAHEAFGHGVEMDMFVKKRALGAEYIGKRVGSELVTMHEGALCDESVTAYAFDDEGTLAGDVIEIDKGILKMRLGIAPTGNGKRENFAHKAYTRMTNTVFDSGEDELEDMIASVKRGYLLKGTESGMEDPKHWGIQCIVNKGYEIIDGKLTGKVVTPVVMTGYVPELLGNISMASRDRRVDGNGGCGKGYKEWVKVADGGPYLKTKARLG